MVCRIRIRSSNGFRDDLRFAIKKRDKELEQQRQSLSQQNPALEKKRAAQVEAMVTEKDLINIYNQGIRKNFYEVFFFNSFVPDSSKKK